MLCNILKLLMTVCKDHHLLFVSEFSSFRLSCGYVSRLQRLATGSECVCTEVKYPWIWSRPPWTHSASPALPVPALVPALPASHDDCRTLITHTSSYASAAHTKILTDTHTPLTMRNSSSHERTSADTNACRNSNRSFCAHTPPFVHTFLFFSFHPSLFIPQSNLLLLSFLVLWTKDTCEAAHNPMTSFFPLVVSHPHQQSSPLNS